MKAGLFAPAMKDEMAALEERKARLIVDRPAIRSRSRRCCIPALLTSIGARSRS